VRTLARAFVSARIQSALAIALGIAVPASAQSLVNGGGVTGTIAPVGDADTYFFTAQAGEGFQVRASDTSGSAFAPEIQIFSSGGVLLHSTWGNEVASVRAASPANDTYSVVIGDRSAANTGSYRIEFTRAPGANEGGTLPNGGAVAGSIDLGDLDSYSFPANAGDALLLRVGDVGGTTLAPELTLYSPSGKLMQYTWGNAAAAINAVAPANGVYTVVLGDRNLSSIGTYALHFTRAPGANEGGALANGGSVVDSIDVGDLDSYTFAASAGEDFQVRVGDLNGTALTPELFVYNPIGGLVAYTWGNEVAAIADTAPLSGTYTVVIGDRSLSGTGAYELFFTRRPGANEGGSLPNGGSIAGVIALGDLDSYTFNASWGQGFQLQVADIGGTALTPELSIYDPSGSLAHYTWSNTVASISATAAASGVYTVVVGDRNGAGVGAYEIHFTRAPGANEGGLLTNGGARIGSITIGDLDSYTFEASWGESIQLRMADLDSTALTPELTVYSPSGAVVAYTWSSEVARLVFVAAATGTYTVVASDVNANGAGVYSLHYARAPGTNENGLIANGASLSGYLDKGDLDSYTLSATVGESLQIVVSEGATAALTPEVFIYSPTGALLASTWSSTIATLNAVATENGLHTVIVGDLNGTGIGLYGTGFVRDVQTYCTAGISASGCVASMAGVGDPSASSGSGFHVLASGTEGNKDGLFFYGTNGRQATPWGNGTSLQCVAPPVIRSPILSGAGANGACNGLFAIDFNAFVAGLSASAPAAGSVVQIQCWYRDPANSANLKTSLSNALEFTQRP
jgi:hypothetical protein